MEIAKVYAGKFGGKVVKVKFELEFNVDHIDSELTPKQVKKMIDNYDRSELGETVLNFLNSATVNVE